MTEPACESSASAPVRPVRITVSWRMRPASEGGNLFDLAGSFYHPIRTGSYFRSLVPAHNQFKQIINSGQVGEGAFNPQMMMR